MMKMLLKEDTRNDHNVIEVLAVIRKVQEAEGVSLNYLQNRGFQIYYDVIILFVHRYQLWFCKRRC